MYLLMPIVYLCIFVLLCTTLTYLLHARSCMQLHALLTCMRAWATAQGLRANGLPASRRMAANNKAMENMLTQ